ncbi:MAG TPA: hypothetical protein VLJ59_11495 [Mycobacteriales bacterium]|nr:hypothetical protein [Mycobacteriales bacterium]
MQQDRLRHLIVIVPGIGGSVLEDETGGVVWGTRRGIAGSVASPSRLSLAERLTPVGLIPTITVVPGFFAVAGYDALVWQICTTFAGSGGGPVQVDVARPGVPPHLGADVVLFPYDFRLGVADAAARLGEELERRLGGLTADARRGRVIVLAHSMGGLVARHWLGGLGGAGRRAAEDCAALVTIGTPHRGAPKALDWLVNGVRVGPLTLGRATELLREWPSAYELLPRYPAVADGASTWLYPHDLARVGHPEFARRAGEAYKLHQDIEAAWRPGGSGHRLPPVLPLFARGHRTLGRAELTGSELSEPKLAVRKEDAEWLPNPGWRGDGTVPAISAIPIELDDDRRVWRAVAERHLPMAGSPALIEILRDYSGASLAAVRGDTPERPWLGVDLEEQYLAGQPVPVTVDLLGAAASPRTAVWVRVRPAGTLRWMDHRCERAGTGWTAELPPLATGEYEVRVDAEGVPEVGRVTMSPDVFAVVEP